MTHLDKLDLSLALSKEEEAERLAAAQERLLVLRLKLGGQTAPKFGPPLCVLFEGWDASGKGGAIKRLVDHLDPRHVRVVQYAAPTPDEKRHHYLLRFARALPGRGGMAVLDRSWYGRVLVERVEGFATKAEWRRAYDEINDYESALCADGMILVKFFLHISDEEQLKRFKAREKDPLKAWKLTDEDWRNREKRAAVRSRGRGDGRPHEHRLRALAPRRGREQALRAGEGDRDRGGARRGRALAFAVCLAGALLRPGLRARPGLRLLLVLVRAFVAQARAGQFGLRDSRARVAHDEPAHHAEADDQRAADDEEHIAAGVAVGRRGVLALDRGRRVSARRAAAARRRRLARRPERRRRGRTGS